MHYAAQGDSKQLKKFTKQYLDIAKPEAPAPAEASDADKFRRDLGGLNGGS